MEIHNQNSRWAFFCVLVCLFAVSCKTTESVIQQYNKVNFGDGLNFMEAKTVAQHVLMSSSFTESFDLFEPYIVINPATAANPNFWYVSFPPRDPFSEMEYLVIIDKRSGGVIRQRSYVKDQQLSIDRL